jgi:hypothetical protein
MMELLMSKGAQHVRDKFGMTPLLLDQAAFHGHEKIVDFLIKSGARFDEGGTVAKNCKACGKEDPGNIHVQHTCTEMPRAPGHLLLL